MRAWLITLTAVVGFTGCTTVSLERHTIALSNSVMDLRYRQVLDSLAMVANHPSALPVYSSIYTGGSTVSDTGTLVSTTLWQHVTGAGSQNGFGSEALNPQVMRQVGENWTLDPVVQPEKLEAIRAACRWVIYGPETLCESDISLLSNPLQFPSPDRHFGVKDRLEQLPPCWLHVGRHRDVPAHACYKAHCGKTWIWVMPEGKEGLADFTLIVQDIARVLINSPSLYYPLPTPSPLKFETIQVPGSPEYWVNAQVAVSEQMRLVPDQPYRKARLENVGSDNFLRSVIAANGISR